MVGAEGSTSVGVRHGSRATRLRDSARLERDRALALRAEAHTQRIVARMEGQAARAGGGRSIMLTWWARRLRYDRCGPVLAMATDVGGMSGEREGDASTLRSLGAPSHSDTRHLDRRDLEKLLEAVISLGSDLDLPSVLRRIVEAAVELTGARFGALGMLDEQRTSFAEFITAGVDDQLRKRIGGWPKGLGVLGALITDARPLRVPDIAEHPGRSGFPPEHPQMRSFLGVPLRVRDVVLGNLYLADKAAGEAFTDVDEELIVGLASAAGIAIDNARLVDQLKRREAALSAIQQVATSVLRGAEPGENLRFVAEQARVLAKADVATFALPAPDGTNLVMDVVQGELGADMRGRRFPRSGSVSGQVLRTGGTAVFADLSEDTHLVQPQVRGGDFGPAIFVALHSGRTAVGTLFVGRVKGSPEFSVADVDMVQSFASQAGLVLETAANRQRLARLSLLEEQERIAKDLHDNVIQQLFSVGMTLQAATSLADGRAVRVQVTEAVDRLDDVIRRIRGTIFDVGVPGRVATPDLRQHLLSVAREFSTSLGFEPAVSFDGPVNAIVDAVITSSALAALREALSDVARYAEATRVEIAVTVADRSLTVRLTADGFGVSGWRRPGHHENLRRMRQSAAELGGQVDVGSGPGRNGTTIEWRVPVTRDPE